MDTNLDRQAEAQVVREHILSLLDDLPPESLNVVNQFVQFLYEQARQGRSVVTKSSGESPPFLYPSVPLPASALDGLVGIMPSVGGDALADTEALYDET